MDIQFMGDILKSINKDRLLILMVAMGTLMTLMATIIMLIQSKLMMEEAILGMNIVWDHHSVGVVILNRLKTFGLQEEVSHNSNTTQARQTQDSLHLEGAIIKTSYLAVIPKKVSQNLV